MRPEGARENVLGRCGAVVCASPPLPSLLPAWAGLQEPEQSRGYAQAALGAVVPKILEMLYKDVRSVAVPAVVERSRH